ncbi:MAG: Ig-like domain-containing protein [Hormoscilla sp.]
MAIFRLTTGNERVRLNRGEVNTVIVESGSRRDVDRVLRFGREDRIDLSAFGNIDAQELIDRAIPRGRNAVILQGDFGRLGLGGITKEQLRPSNFITSTPVDPEENRTIESNDDLDVELAIERASDLSRYTEEELASVEELVVIETEPDALTPDGSSLLELLGFRRIRRLRNRRNTYIVELPRDEIIRDDSSLIEQLESIDGIEYYPLVKIEPVLDYIPNDPFFEDQWHLLNTGQTGGRAGVDANVTAAWDIPNPRNPSQTVRGRDVVIGIVDDGLDITHPDIAARYRNNLSNDFLERDGDPSPNLPRNHGTLVAGVAAANGDDGIGVTGAAPQSSIAALRLIGSGYSDELVPDALGHENQEIDIYQNSWSPIERLDLRGPNPLALTALQTGVDSGRGGRGNIYVFSAGNNRESRIGKSGDDNVNYNGYANSRYTIAVGAINHNGVHAPYSEPGAPLLISAPSSEGLGRDVGVGVTTTGFVATESPENDYTNKFSGTSAAAPLVSGVIALMLEANPELSWRDVQHIIVETAEQNDRSNPDWVINGAGFPVNHFYGFGLIDAAAAVQAAIDWTPVAPEIVIAKEFTGGLAVPDDNIGGVSRAVTINSDIQVEWAEVVFEGTHPRRGDWEIALVSPDGTESILAEERPDENPDINWTFTSARHWGESSVGRWTLRVSDLNSGETGTLDFAELRLIGTANEFAPPNQPNQPPIAVDDVATTEENSSVSIDVLANDSGNPLSFQGIPSSTEFGGLVSLNGGTIAYTPANGFAGTDSFSYTISGGSGSTDSATVTVTVESRNTAPIANDDFTSTEENSSVNIFVLDNDFDPDGDAIAISNFPVNTFVGSVSISGNAVVYNPDFGFTGTDSFSYTIADGNGGTDSATVTVTIESANQPPIALDDFATTAQNISVSIPAFNNDFDPDEDQLFLEGISSPTEFGGSASFNDNAILYTPAFGFTGTDSFSYTLADENGSTDSATVTVTVESANSAVNSAPIALDDFAVTTENISLSIFVLDNDFDPDGDAIAISNFPVSTAFGGTISQIDNTLVYTPQFGFTGIDSFVYTISDGQDTSTATVSVIVESAGGAGESSGSISGVKFLDTDRDGVRDAGEQGLAGWTIFFDTNNNGVLDNNEVSVVTGANGSYSFGGLLAGTYNVREIQQPGFLQTTGNPTITLLAGQNRTGVNFGNVGNSFSSSVRANFDVRPADILTGTPGIGDTFSLSSSQTVAIEGFVDGEDVLQVSGGLIFSDLDVTAGTGSSIGNTLIAIESSNQVIAELIGVQPVVITEDDFTFI